MSIIIYKKDSTKMEEIDTATIDMVITSPPYWNIIDYHHPKQLGKGLTYNQFLFYLNKTLIECMRVLKEDSFAALIVGDIRSKANYCSNRPNILPLHSDVIKVFLDMGFDFYQHFIWKKFVKKGVKGKIIYGSVGKGNYKNFAVPPYLYSDLLMEHILVFRKPGIRNNVPSLQSRLEDEDAIISIEDLRNWVDPIWYIDPTKDLVNPGKNSIHPATFPSELIYRLIKMFSLPHSVILDPFIGIGTTIETALKTKRNIVGYEINDDYIEEMTKRYSLQANGIEYFKNNN